MKTKISKIHLLFALSILSSFKAFSQNEGKRINTTMWSKLSKVTYKVSSDQYGEMNVPIFSKEIKDLEGKEITISGYIVPADGPKGVFRPEHFILSSLPPEACFFCGTGGPESVVEVYLKESIKYTESPIIVKGKLTLNSTDSYQLMYILEDVEFLGISKVLSSN